MDTLSNGYIKDAILGRNVAIMDLEPVISPREIKELYPLSDAGSRVFNTTIAAMDSVLDRDLIIPRRDLSPNLSKIVVLCGPCSIHNEAATLEYASRLKEIADEVSDRMIVLMRFCVSKPRSGTGWKGILSDPDLDGTDNGNEGYKLSRKLAIKILGEIGLPLGMEILDSTTPHQILDDVLSYAWVGARNASTNAARDLGSILSPPVGVKNPINGTSFDESALNVKYVTEPHTLEAPNSDGVAHLYRSTGNARAHLILRGMNEKPNYEPGYVRLARDALVKLGLRPNMMIDFNHTNSGKNPDKQWDVMRCFMEQVQQDELYGGRNLMGCLIESNLVGGNVSISDYLANPTAHYGKSVTDKCLGFDDTARMLREMHAGLRR